MSYQVRFSNTMGNHSYVVNTVLRTLNPVNARKYETIKGARIGRTKAVQACGVPSQYYSVDIEWDGYGGYKLSEEERMAIVNGFVLGKTKLFTTTVERL